MARKTTKADIRAAGGVVWRIDGGALQVALVHRLRYDDWSLPKGKLEAGEDELRAAVREVGEEIGAQVAVSRRLRAIGYQVGDASKTVAFWVMHYRSGEFVANDEVDEIAWLPADAARSRLSYEVEAWVLEEFTSTPVPEAVVVLVRHAKAGKRSAWQGDDVRRPLDTVGRAQARRLDRFLTAFAPDRIVSARPLRCVQTVEPTAHRLSLPVTLDAAFDDENFHEAPELTESALLELAKPRRVTVVASQGGAIPGVIERLLPGVHATDTRKGAAWVLSLVDGTVVSADYYDDASR